MECFQTNELVWVKLGRVYWPAVVKDKDECSEFLDALKNEPAVVAEFFDRKLQDVYKDSEICRYNCAQKQDIILRAIQSLRSLPDMMATFKQHVVQAERLYGGDVHVLSRVRARALRAAAGDAAAAAVAASMFASASKPAGAGGAGGRQTDRRTHDASLLGITHPRFVATNDHHSKDLIQQCRSFATDSGVDSGADESGGRRRRRYQCDQCEFGCSRVDVIVQHVLWHARCGRKRRVNGTASAAGGSRKKAARLRVNGETPAAAAAATAVVDDGDVRRTATVLGAGSAVLLADWQEEEDGVEKEQQDEERRDSHEQERIRSDISRLLASDEPSQRADDGAAGARDEVVFNTDSDTDHDEQEDGRDGDTVGESGDWWSLVQRRRSSSCQSSASSSLSTPAAEDDWCLRRSAVSGNEADEESASCATDAPDNGVCVGSSVVGTEPAGSGDQGSDDGNHTEPVCAVQADDNEYRSAHALAEERTEKQTDDDRIEAPSMQEANDERLNTDAPTEENADAVKERHEEEEAHNRTEDKGETHIAADPSHASHVEGDMTQPPCVTALPANLRILAVPDSSGEEDVYMLAHVEPSGAVRPISPAASCLAGVQTASLLAYEVPCDEDEPASGGGCTRTAYLSVSQLASPSQHPRIARMLLETTQHDQQEPQPQDQDQHQRQPQDQDQHQRQPQDQDQHQRQPQDQDQHQRQPLDQDQHQRQPLDQDQHQRQPQDQDQHQRQPQDQDQHQRQPLDQDQPQPQDQDQPQLQDQDQPQLQDQDQPQPQDQVQSQSQDQDQPQLQDQVQPQPQDQDQPQLQDQDQPQPQDQVQSQLQDQDQSQPQDQVQSQLQDQDQSQPQDQVQSQLQDQDQSQLQDRVQSQQPQVQQ